MNLIDIHKVNMLYMFLIIFLLFYCMPIVIHIIPKVPKYCLMILYPRVPSVAILINEYLITNHSEIVHLQSHKSIKKKVSVNLRRS